MIGIWVGSDEARAAAVTDGQASRLAFDIPAVLRYAVSLPAILLPATLLPAILLLALAAPRPVAGQDYRSSVGWNAGALWVTALNAGAARSTPEGGEPSALEVAPGPGWTTGIQFDHWLWNGVFGVRAGGAYARHDLDWSNGTRAIGSWIGEADLLVRIFVPEPEHTYIPFVALGAAGVRYGLGEGPLTTFPDADASHPGNRVISFAASAGMGLDVVTRWGWDESPIILRVEAADQVAPRSPLRSAETGKRFHFVHNARLTVGLHAGLGSLPGREPARREPPVRVVVGGHHP